MYINAVVHAADGLIYHTQCEPSGDTIVGTKRTLSQVDDNTEEALPSSKKVKLNEEQNS